MAVGLKQTSYGKPVLCSRCNSAKCIKYGKYRGYQRFRCTACGHTFAAGLNRQPGVRMVEKYRLFTAMCRQRSTLRSVAAALNIAVSTAFRWRHLYLAGLHITFPDNSRSADQTALLATTSVYAGNPAVANSLPNDSSIARFRFGPYLAAPVAWVAHWAPVAGSRVYSFPLDTAPTSAAAERILPASAVALGTRLVTPRWTAVSVETHSEGNKSGSRRWRLMPLASRAALPDGYARRMSRISLQFRKWMGAFRGVALKYLGHYVTWYNHCAQPDG